MSTFLDFVGFVRFPRNPRDLTAAVCPACLVDRVGVVCGTCGLDLASPFIAELDASSMDASAALDRRLELIGRIRHDSAASRQPAPVIAPPTSRVASAATHAPAELPAPTAAPVSLPPAEPRRHLGVQVILLIVGVSLLSVGAIFFLVYAFITFGLVWRSVIIVAVTIAAILGATLLKRRGLRATAEAIAALAIVFVYLDVFAVRANDLFGAGGSNALLYWGIALLLSAIGFALWHRRGRLRVPSLAAFATAAPGFALLVGGLFEGADESVRVFAGLVALAASGLAHPLGRHRAEKTIVAVFGVVGLGLGAIASGVLVGPVGAPAIGLGIVAIVALAQVVLVSRLGTSVVPARIAAVIGAGSVAVATFVVAVRVEQAAFLAFWPVVAAVVVALALELLARSVTSSLPRHFARIAARTAAGVTVVILLTPTVLAVTPAVTLAGAVVPRWVTTGGSLVTIRGENAAAVLALLVTVVLVAAAWAIAGTLDERHVIVLSAAAATLLFAVPLVGVLWLAVVLWLLAAAAAIVALAVARMRGWGVRVRVVIASSSVAAMALAYLSSWASIDTWWFGSVAVVVLLVASRATTTLVVVRASTLALAAVLALVAVSAEGWHINERFAAAASPWLESAYLVAALGVLLIVAASALSRRLSAPETRVLFWIGVTGTAAAAAAIVWAATIGVRPESVVLPHGLTATLLGLGLVIALVSWTAPESTAPFGLERIAASVLLAPAAAWALDSLARTASLPAFVAALAPITAALIVGAAALALSPRRDVSRIAIDAGVCVVALPTVALSLSTDAPWLVLLLAAVTALVLAISTDGLFSSARPRRQLGWLSLALGIGALWWALDDAAIDTLELFTLPVAGALLIVALLGWRAARRDERPATAAPMLFLAALVVAILPVAVAAMTGPTVRTVVIASICAALLLAVSVATRTGPLQPYLDAASLVGAAGLLIAGFGRPLVIGLAPRTDDLQVDVWAASSFLVLVAAVIVQSRIGDERTHRRRVEASEVVLVLALVGLSAVELVVVDGGRFGTVRSAALIVLLAAAYAAAQLRDREPFTRTVGWVAFAGAVVAAADAIRVGAIDPVEWATAIVGLALIVVGSIRLRANASRGSWPSLAPGILVLVLPSLFATFSDAPVWRLVALGAVCVALIVIGALARLQAPLVIGAVVVLVHAIRTFAPQIVAVYQLTEWWVWAVIGGAIILFVAVTLERRVRDLRAVGARVSALR